MKLLVTFLITLVLVLTTLQTFTQTPPAQTGTNILDKGWMTSVQGGSAIMEDLGAWLSPFSRPSADTLKPI